MVGSIHNIHSFFLVCELFKGSVGKSESSTCYRMERTIFFISYIWDRLFFSYAIGERGMVKMSDFGLHSITLRFPETNQEFKYAFRITEEGMEDFSPLRRRR
jgi:hypothetical protein